MKKSMNLGIVLRAYFPLKHKLIIFDKDLGKVEGFFTSKNEPAIRLCNGSIFSYSAQQMEKKFLLNNDIEILEISETLANNDINFFHEVLGLCCDFVPAGIPSDEIFNMLCFLFRSNKIWNEQAKKIFIYKFLFELGFYPENCCSEESFNYILSLPIDMITQITINLEEEKKLDKWVLSICGKYKL